MIKFKYRIGSRVQVMHGTAKMTGGRLRKKDLNMASKKSAGKGRSSRTIKKEGETMFVRYGSCKLTF